MATLTDDLKKTAVDAGYVVVGITDLAVERARGAQAQLAQVRAEVRTELAAEKIQARVKAVPAQARTLPTAAVSKGLEAAGKVEEGFDDLAGRGKQLVERLRKQRATQDLVQQGKATLSRTKAAVTTVRRGAKDTKVAANGAVTSARKDAATSAEAARESIAKRTSPAVKRTATTAKKRATSSQAAAKSAGTSARTTATKAVKAASAAAEKVGD